nr:glycosyltransferase family 4 protein [Pedobacter panaciterrae]
MSKNILFLSFYFKPDLSAGSFRNTLLSEVFTSKLKDLGSDEKIIVVTSRPNRYGSFSVEAPEKEVYDNLIIHRVNVGAHQSGLVMQILIYFKYAFAVFKIQRQYEYETIYSSSSRLMTAFLGACLKRFYGKKLYLDIRDIFRESISEVLSNRFLIKVLDWILFFIEKFTFTSANIINVVTPDMIDYFKKFGVQTRCYTNGIDEVFFGYDFDHNNNSKRKIITFAGNIGKAQALEKVLPFFAKAFENEVEIIVLGDGSGRRILLDSIVKMDLENIKLIDPVPRETVLKYYKQSDYLFLNLDDKEAFYRAMPTKLFEYSATGKTIIAGLKGFAQDFFVSSINNIISFDSNNYNELIKKFKDHIPEKSDRTAFIEKYRRKNIIIDMADYIYKLHKS